MKPIWGNGWWNGEKTIEPPATFSVRLHEGSLKDGFQGLIQDGEFSGRLVSGSKTFVDDADYLTVEVVGDGETGKTLTGYVRVQ